MRKLDEQLLELQKQKLKADFLRLLRSTIENTSDTDYTEVEKEVKEEVFAFFDSHIDMIENGESPNMPETEIVVKEDFSIKQRTILKQMADKLDSKQVMKDLTSISKEVPKDPSIDMNKSDKIAFALQYRSLGGKTMQIKSMGNAKGVVTGMDAPYIVLRLETGRYVQVPVEDLV